MNGGVFKKCDMKDCAEEGAWIPSLVFYAHRSLKNDTPLVSWFKLWVCDAHRDSMTVGDVLSDDGWNKIARSLQICGRAVPDRSRTKLRFNKPEDVPTDFLKR